jgi:hypothetical protein
LDCKATRQHSPLSRASLGPKDFPRDLHRKPADFIGDSFKIDLQYNAGTHWRAARRKNKRAMLAHVAASAFSMS